MALVIDEKVVAVEHSANLSTSQDDSSASTIIEHVFKLEEHRKKINAVKGYMINWTTVPKNHDEVNHDSPKNYASPDTKLVHAWSFHFGLVQLDKYVYVT